MNGLLQHLLVGLLLIQALQLSLAGKRISVGHVLFTELFISYTTSFINQQKTANMHIITATIIHPIGTRHSKYVESTCLPKHNMYNSTEAGI